MSSRADVARRVSIAPAPGYFAQGIEDGADGRGALLLHIVLAAALGALAKPALAPD